VTPALLPPNTTGTAGAPGAVATMPTAQGQAAQSAEGRL
jgi:hypothetical protein